MVYIDHVSNNLLNLVLIMFSELEACERRSREKRQMVSNNNKTTTKSPKISVTSVYLQRRAIAMGNIL